MESASRAQARARLSTRRSRARRKPGSRSRSRWSTRAGTCSRSNAWKVASSIPCTRRPPRPSARRPTSAAPGPRAPSARRSTSLTRLASPSPPDPSGGPRWKAARRSWRGASGSGAGGAPGGNWELRGAGGRGAGAGAAAASPAASGNATSAWRRKPRPRFRKEASMKVACIGIGWWSDVLADAIKRSGKLTIAGCYTRSADKRDRFAAKYGCRAYPSYEAVLADRGIEAIVNTTPNAAHLETTRAAGAAGQHVFLAKPIANTIADARAITAACRKAKVVLALGYQRRRESQFRWIKNQIAEGAFGRLGNAEAHIRRDAG